MIFEIIRDGTRPSLIFANETYLVRHFLTQAILELRRASNLTEESDADSVRIRDDSLLRARRLYKAALTTLDAAEQEPPRRIRTINGESFWDRFARVSKEREDEKPTVAHWKLILKVSGVIPSACGRGEIEPTSAMLVMTAPARSRVMHSRLPGLLA